jgi:hypothetical protein
MTLAVALRLGRVSNLPTVWTNALAGMALAGGVAPASVALSVLIALSLFYTGGMWLNDAFDREIDALERPERPIPAGQAEPATVFALGFGMLAAGLVLLASTGIGWHLPAAGLLLASCIVFYDWRHKGHPSAPWVMGLCRALVYVVAALAVAPMLPLPVLAAAAVTLAYVAGITYSARREALGELGAAWPLALLAIPLGYGLLLAVTNPWAPLAYAAFLAWLAYALFFLVHRKRAVPQAVAAMLAAICLLDATYITAADEPLLALAAGFAFLLTVAMQRHVPAT